MYSHPSLVVSRLKVFFRGFSFVSLSVTFSSGFLFPPTGASVEHLRPGTRQKIAFWSRQHQILPTYLNRQANLAVDNFLLLGPRQLTIFPKGIDHGNIPLLSIVQQILHPWVVTRISQQPSVRQHQQLLPHYQLVDQGKCRSIRCLAKSRSALRKWLSLLDHPKIIREFKEIASLVGETWQSVSDDDSLSLVLAMILQQPMTSPFGIWHECLTVKVTCWQSTNSSLSDSSLPLPRASQERDRRRRWWGAWNWSKCGCDGQEIYFAFSNYWLAVKSNITHDPMCSLSKRWRNNLKGLWLWINWHNCNS